MAVHCVSSLIPLVLSFAPSLPLRIISPVSQRAALAALFWDRNGERCKPEAKGRDETCLITPRATEGRRRSLLDCPGAGRDNGDLCVGRFHLSMSPGPSRVPMCPFITYLLHQGLWPLSFLEKAILATCKLGPHGAMTKA